MEEARTPPSLQCIRYTDTQHWAELGKDDIWYAPFEYSAAVDKVLGDTCEFDAQLRCLLQQLATRGAGI
jgi:hypothetical protein